MQQAQGRVSPTMKSQGVALNQDAGLESEADQMGAKAADASPADATSLSSARPVTQPANGVLQRKLKLTGLTEEKRKAFVTKMSTGSVIQFTLDATGLVQQADAKAVPTDEYGKQIVAAIKDAQTVNLNFVKQDNAVFGDSFASGKVDYDDMIGMPERLFLSNVMHFIVERFAIPDYEKSKSTATRADFLKAHGKGQEAQERQMKEWFPKKTIKYIGEGEWLGFYLDGKKDGSWSFYQGHALRKTVRYVAGLKQGHGMVFGVAGNLTLTLEFDRDRIHGQVRFFASDGLPIATYKYIYDKLDRIEHYLLHEESPPKDKIFLPDF